MRTRGRYNIKYESKWEAEEKAKEGKGDQSREVLSGSDIFSTIYCSMSPSLIRNPLPVY